MFDVGGSQFLYGMCLYSTNVFRVDPPYTLPLSGATYFPPELLRANYIPPARRKALQLVRSKRAEGDKSGNEQQAGGEQDGKKKCVFYHDKPIADYNVLTVL